jgi:hypothetical protein
MEDFKKLSVDALRKLARELLGKGATRLRTRAQLLAALGKVSPPAGARAGDGVQARARVKRSARAPAAGPEAPPSTRKSPARAKPAASAAPPARPGSRARAKPAASAKPPPSTQPAAQAKRSAPPRTRKAKATPRIRRPGEAAPASAPVAAPTEGNGLHPPEGPNGSGGGPTAAARPPPADVPPVSLGAQLAALERGRGPAPRRPPLRAAGAPPASAGTPPDGGPKPKAAQEARLPPPPPRPLESGFFEDLGAPRLPHAPLPALEVPEPPAVTLPPADVGTEAPVLLVRDPTTLFVFWDFRRELERGAALGFVEPRLLHGERPERSVELPLGARSTYVEGLHAGEAYSAEVMLLGRDGWTRPMGRRSGPRRLPPDGPSERLEVRTLRMAWSEPLSQIGQPSEALEVPGSEPLDSPRRLPLPTSPGAPGGGGGPGGPVRSGTH